MPRLSEPHGVRPCARKPNWLSWRLHTDRVGEPCCGVRRSTRLGETVSANQSASSLCGAGSPLPGAGRGAAPCTVNTGSAPGRGLAVGCTGHVPLGPVPIRRLVDREGGRSVRGSAQMSPAAHSLRARASPRSVHVGPIAKAVAARRSRRRVPHRGRARELRAGRRHRVGRDGRVVRLGGPLHELESVVDAPTEDPAAAAGHVIGLLKAAISDDDLVLVIEDLRIAIPTEQRIDAAGRHMLGLGPSHDTEAPPRR